MQGFELMLKAAGIDPQKMAEQAMERFLPELEKFKGTVVDTIKVEVIQPMAEAFGQQLVELNGKAMANLVLRLDSIDEAIKAINPGYTPLVVDLSKVTNPDTPEGGPVDMSKVDVSKIGSQEAQEALPTGQVDVGTQVTAEAVQEAAQADPAVAEDVALAGGAEAVAEAAQASAGAGQAEAPSALQEHAEAVQAADQVQGG